MSFEAMWRELAPLGRSARSGGYFRQPWTSVDAELDAWFLEAAGHRGLDVKSDVFGNRIAWWRPEATQGPGLLVGSHLDSVLDGGAYDGPLGVVSALSAVDRLREQGFEPTRPIGIGVFREEEGSRFGLACLGSRLATGQTSWEDARALKDRDGVALEDALAGWTGFRDARFARSSTTGGAARSSTDVGAARSSTDVGLLADVDCFVELHVEQGRHLVDVGHPVGVASSIWPHGRYRFDFTGEANHAGTTRMEDRHDPMLTYAMTALAANKQARLSQGGRATFGRVEVEPNGTNAVPSLVAAWLDARCETPELLADLVGQIRRLAAERAERDGTQVSFTAESVSGACDFDPALAQRIAGDHAGGDWPIIATQAGHDAGILSAAGIPTAMLFVRNPTGVSHSPDERAEMPDCLAGVEALATTMARLS